jgi:hypothetical protein
VATTATPPTTGRELVDALEAAVRRLAAALRPGARNLPVLTGLTPGTGFTAPLENVRARATEILAASGRVYRHGYRVVLDTDPPGELLPLREGAETASGVAGRVANLFVCRHDDLQFPPPHCFIDLVLKADPLPAALPEVRCYARRPVFDPDFVLCGRGWHPRHGILVHGPDVDPLPWPPAPLGAGLLDRLPWRLRKLLGGFCFREDADLANAVAFLLTGLLVNHFVEPGKPIALIDGNQPGLGKTLLARLFGLLFDGRDPGLVRYTPDDDELEKRVCAALRSGTPAIVAIDNAKVTAGTEINSTTLEKHSTAAVVNIRVLGTNTEFVRPNDLLWAITMNGTRASPDLVSRGLPVRLSYEGDPAGRQFVGEGPLALAKAQRVELLGELAGMVVHWTQAGRPPGTARHRLTDWAEVVGGIMKACGLPEFLSNLTDAAGEFSTSSDTLVALAEAVIRQGGPFAEVPPAADPAPAPKTLKPGEWASYAQEAGLLDADDRNARSKAVKIGKFLTPNVGRSVRVDVGGRTGTAVLRSSGERANAKHYHFDVCWDAPTPDTGAATNTTSAAPAAGPAGSPTRGEVSGDDIPVTSVPATTSPTSVDEDSLTNTEVW